MFYKVSEVTKGINRLTSLFFISVIIFFAFQVSIADDIDDGYSDAERTAIYSQSTISNFTTTNQELYRGYIIVDSTRPNAYFGLYRFSQMTDPGWNLFRQTIDWAINYQNHASTKICFARSGGVPGPGDEDAFAAYNFLIDSMGFDSANMLFINYRNLPNTDLSTSDIVIVFGYTAELSTILALDIPFITTSPQLATDMGICNFGWGWLHESRNFVFVKDNSHNITNMYDTGQLLFAEKMWMDALYATGNGVVLVTAEEEQVVPPIAISITPNTPNPNIGEISHVSINYGNGNGLAPFETAGFELLISYDSDRLSVNSVTQGALLDSCQWEFFTYSIDSAADCGGVPCPEGMIRIVALADVFTFGSPLCNLSSYGTLVDIEFQVTTNTAMECSNAPISFYWYDCSDNTFASVMGDTLFISKYDNNTFPPHEIDTTFPTGDGATDECLTENGSTQRSLSFRNSSIFIEGCIYEPILNRGDINLNTIPYEIADVVLFGNYLFFGTDVFTVNPEQQILATDVNKDGLTSTLDDYVYLWRVIIGDTNPFPRANSSAFDTVIFTQDTLNKKVSFSYPDSLRAVYLIFEGDLRPWGWGDDTTETLLPFDGTHTRVLLDVFFTNDSTLFTHDSLFYYTGEGKLVGAFAAYDGINSIPTTIAGGSGSCCQNRGNVEGDLLGLINISDLVNLVFYLFATSTPPPCNDEADINTDWKVDIADLIYLVDFMFKNGPPPQPCQ